VIGTGTGSGANTCTIKASAGLIAQNGIFMSGGKGYLSGATSYNIGIPETNVLYEYTFVQTNAVLVVYMYWNSVVGTNSPVIMYNVGNAAWVVVGSWSFYGFNLGLNNTNGITYYIRIVGR